MDTADTDARPFVTPGTFSPKMVARFVRWVFTFNQGLNGRLQVWAILFLAVPNLMTGRLVTYSSYVHQPNLWVHGRAQEISAAVGVFVIFSVYAIWVELVGSKA